jgi:aspartyl-tRNA(Asn)/glutamyl-tRNA(Gln) amidotransferase subunit A
MNAATTPTTPSSPGIVERTERALGRIEAHDERLRAMITVDTEGALRTAREAQTAAAQGRWLGLLHGMTMVVKDNIDSAGLRTTYGSRFFEDHVPNRDAPVLRRLRAAGAVVLGKSSLHEFAFGVRSNNPVRGQCLNPWDPARIPGGSSGGSGAALAADYCQGALGSDTGGSVRLPAAFNGVSGLRPTVGRVPSAGSMPVSASQDTIGPMARSVADVARIFAVIAGPEGTDPTSVDRPLPNFLPALGDGIHGLRLGIPRNHYLEGADAQIADAFHAAARVLEAEGARLVDIDVPGAEDMHHWASVVIFSDACAVHARRLAADPGRFDPQVLARMRTGLDFSGVDYARAMREREAWRHRLSGVFRKVDMILSPTVHVPVPAIDDGVSLLQSTREATRNTYAGAFAQLPGLSVPCGIHADGLPIGLQLEAPWWQEPRLLQVGHCYQQRTDWHLRQALPEA